MSRCKKFVFAVGLVTVLAIGGCGGDDDTPVVANPPPTTAGSVPDSAGASVPAFLDFILSLNASDETSEPLTIRDGFVAPTDDGAEPRPLT